MGLVGFHIVLFSLRSKAGLASSAVFAAWGVSRYLLLAGIDEVTDV